MSIAQAYSRFAPPRAALRLRTLHIALRTYTCFEMIGEGQRPAGETLEKTRPIVREPDLYKVILLNDDYTTMDFVVEVLETVFLKRPAEAHRIMMLVHTQGRGVCGVYPQEIAETKVDQVQTLARQQGFPLQATLERD